MTRRMLAVLALVVSSFGLSGCSLAFVTQAPSDYPPQQASSPPNCTAGKAMPVIDLQIASNATVVALATLLRGIPTLLVTGSSLAVAAGFGIASGFGFSRTQRCRNLRDKFHKEQYKRLQELKSKVSSSRSPPSSEASTRASSDTGD